MMICRVRSLDYGAVLAVINEAAHAFKGVIPEDRWKDPYMPLDELETEIRDGVEFYGLWEEGKVVGVMGIQRVDEITLIRHAYVTTDHQRKGIGKMLLLHLLNLAQTHVILVGTWASASWAVEFYERNGFKLLESVEKDLLLRRYWRIPDMQVETSVVLRLDR
jgi:GNAT superfamily N-acetyltransferase